MSLQTEIPEVAGKRPVHWPSVLQFSLSLIAITLLLSGAVGFVALGMFGAMTAMAGGDSLTILLTAASFFGIALLLVPSAYYGLFRLMGKPTIDSRRLLGRIPPGLWLLLFPVVLLVGFAASRLPALSWLVLPALHVLALGLPIAWMVAVAVRGLPLGSAQRAWGVFGSGLALGPLVISVLEGLAVAAIVILAVVFLVGQPDIIAELQAFVENYAGTQPTEAEIMEALGPYMLRPGVIFAVLALGAVIVPLIEEALKPIGVWLLAGRPLSAAAGFAAGALSGAGFALTESMLLSSNGGEWALLVLVRIGTGAIHILTTALTGWALAVAWKQRKFVVLGVTYLTTVIIHALWNGLTITTVFAGLAQAQGQPDALPWISRVAVAAPLVLVLLAFGSLALLLFFNRRLASAVERRAAPVGSSPTLLPAAEMPVPALQPAGDAADGIEGPGNVL